MREWTVAVLVPVLTTLTVSTARAQETAPQSICRSSVCGVLVDWGPEGRPTVVDRRYGTLGDFEETVIRGLLMLGYRFNQDPGEDAFTVRLRPRISSAICDRVRGLNPDNSCRMITEVRTDFMNKAEDIDLPGNLRIRNRCGNGELMDIEKFSEYAVAMLDYTLARDEDRKRPTPKC